VCGGGALRSLKTDSSNDATGFVYKEEGKRRKRGGRERGGAKRKKTHKRNGKGRRMGGERGDKNHKGGGVPFASKSGQR